jgi:DNA repair photolyase
MTVTTTDDRVSRWLEVRAPLASRRLRALGELRDAGVPTFAFVGPLLPHFVGPVLAEELPDVQEAYLRARTKGHRAELDAIVQPLLTNHGLRLRFEEVIYHDDFKKLPDGASPSDLAT